MAKNDQLVDPMSNLLGYRLRRASALAMADLARALEPLGLSPTLASVLLVIDENPGNPQSRIGQALGIKRANIAPMIARLEKAKLISREDLPGRAIGLSCTRDGSSTAKRIKKIMSVHENRVFGHIASDKQDDLIATMQSVVEGMTSPSKKAV